MTDMLHLALLGELRVALNDVPVSGFVSSKAQAMLCYLAVTGRPHTRTALAALFWADLPEDAAATNLRQVIANLRRLLEPYLLVTRQTVAFNTVAPYTLDTSAFEQDLWGLEALEKPSSTSAVVLPDALAALQQAVEHYNGDFLKGFSVRDAPMFDEWALVQQERYRELALHALHILVVRLMARGEYASALAYTSRELALDVWCEEAHRQMMLLLARTGRHTAALAQYERCRRVLWDELGVEPMPETTALYERIRTAQSLRRPILPPQPTPFVGREQERTELASRLADPAYRLLTIVGPGGVGKTRLALQVAAEQGMRFLHGSVFVPLAAVSNARLLVSTIATALDLGLRGGDEPSVQLLNYLREKELLLVIDNFEHMIDAGTEVLAEVLQQAPDVKVLVTSRERLNLQEEWLLSVGGLAVPAQSVSSEAETYDAVALFLESAHRVHASLDLDNGDRASVVRICRLLEGLPLGLELAAASLRMLTCAELARELEHNLDLLQTTLRNVPARQRSLRATFEYSWRLLSAQEQDVYRRLSVFRGGFTRAAAVQVARTTLPLLQSLVDKSLLRRGPTGRYDLHPVLRQYAEEKLAHSLAMQAEAHDRHGIHYAEFLYRQQEPLKGAQQPAVLAEIGDEIENVRVAWQWAIDRYRLDALEQLAESLYQWHRIQGLSNEGAEMFGQAAGALASVVPHASSTELMLGKLLARQGMFAAVPSRFTEAREELERAMALVRPLGDLHEIAFILHALALVERSTGDYTGAQRLYRESLDIRESLGDQSGVAMALLGLAGTAYYLGVYEEASDLLQRGLPIARRLGDQKLIADFLIGVSFLAMAQGNQEDAQRRLQESLGICKAMGDREGMIMCLTGLGKIASTLGDLPEAKRLCEASLLICQEIGSQIGMQDNLDTLGGIAMAQQEYGEARQWYQQNLAVADAAGDQAGKAIALASLGEVACTRADYAVAERFFLQSLQIARELQRAPVMLAALSGLSSVFIQTGRQTQARELLTVTLIHPALEDRTREQAEQLRSTLDAAGEHGTARPFDEVVATLLLSGLPIPPGSPR